MAVYCANAEETGKAKNAKIAMLPMVMSGVKYFFIRTNCLPEKRENVKLISAIEEKILPVNPGAPGCCWARRVARETLLPLMVSSCAPGSWITTFAVMFSVPLINVIWPRTALEKTIVFPSTWAAEVVKDSRRLWLEQVCSTEAPR